MYRDQTLLTQELSAAQVLGGAVLVGLKASGICQREWLRPIYILGDAGGGGGGSWCLNDREADKRLNDSPHPCVFPQSPAPPPGAPIGPRPLITMETPVPFWHHPYEAGASALGVPSPPHPREGFLRLPLSLLFGF